MAGKLKRDPAVRDNTISVNLACSLILLTTFVMVSIVPVVGIVLLEFTFETQNPEVKHTKILYQNSR
jgi:hypothetical protein